MIFDDLPWAQVKYFYDFERDKAVVEAPSAAEPAASLLSFDPQPLEALMDSADV